MANKEYGTMLSPLELEVSLEQLKINMPAMLEYQRILAKQTRAKYIALLAEGFTKDQALELCKVL